MATPDFRIEFKEDTNWKMHRLHFHETFEILLNLSEGGEFFMDQNMYPLHANTLFILRANTLHRDQHDETDTRFRRYVFQIMPTFLEQLSTPQTNFAALLRRAEPCVQLTPAESAVLVRGFDALRANDGVGFGTDIRARICLYKILLRVCQSVRSSGTENGTSNPDYVRVEPILSHIRQIYTEPFKLDDLARHFNVDKHYLCHMFKKGTGFSVMEYTIQLRIIEAQRLLRHGASVQEAGEQSGFQSYEYFIRSFSKYVGTSPKQYSKQYRDGDRATSLPQKGGERR